MWEETLLFVLSGLAVLLALFGLEELILEFAIYFKKLRPKILNKEQLNNLSHHPEKTLAILLPAWKEHEIIFDAVQNHLNTIDYSQFSICIGMYPNDKESLALIPKLKKLSPKIKIYINSLEGPTTKGQMLNHMIYEMQSALLDGRIHAIVLQDAEDILNPYLLKLGNQQLDEYDFVQTPVFSFKRKNLQLVASTYMDEFAESHLGTLLLRSHLKAGVPSAGVGTFIRAKTLLNQTTDTNSIFNEQSLTEDYELGLQLYKKGYNCTFSCYGYQEENQIKYIATQEFFPDRLMVATRQKTRWILGNCLQACKELGWMKRIAANYFLYRDRRAILSNIIVLASYSVFLLGAITPILWTPSLKILVGGNVSLFIIRLFIRIKRIHTLYGIMQPLQILMRWPTQGFINGVASVIAVFRFTKHRIFKSKLVWQKTPHYLPSSIIVKGQNATR